MVVTQSPTHEKSATKGETPPRLRLEYLDGIRACAAVSVMLSHSLTHVPLPSGPAAAAIVFLSFIGRISVDVFIAISGFCLMLPVAGGDGSLRGGASQFFLRRARRILPPYYLAMAFSLLMIWLLIGRPTGTHWDVSLPVTRKAAVAHLLLLQDVYSSSKINHAFWSIAVEWQIYFLFPALIILGQRVGIGKAILMAVALSFLGFLALQQTKLAGLTLDFVGLFALGMLGATVACSPSKEWLGLRDRLPWRTLTWGFALTLLGVCIWMASHGKITSLAGLDFVVGLWACCTLTAASLPSPNRLRRVMEFKPLVFVGAFSYSLYLTHAPIQQILWQYMIEPMRLSDGLSIMLLTSLGSVLAIAFAYGFFLVCERPFMRRSVPGGEKTVSRFGIPTLRRTTLP